MKSDKVAMYGITDIGAKRKNNEDQIGYLLSPHLEFQLMLVADGMGGHLKGEVASSIVRDTFIKSFENSRKPSSIKDAKKALKKIIKRANSLVHKLSSKRDEYYGMGTTVVLALVLDEETIILNCGDSRAYTYTKKDSTLKQITTDQTCVEYLYRLGVITKEEMKTHPKRHVLMNALGIASSVDFDVTVIDNSSFDYLLLCSDGYSNMVDEIETIELFKSHSQNNVKEICGAMVAKAIENGGLDNISVTLMEVIG